MTASDLTFPVVCIHKGTMFTSKTLEVLTRTTTAALRGGLFNDLHIVDSTGQEYIVKNAKKLHGIGPLWGFNVFLNRTVRVDIEITDASTTISADEVRRLVLRDFRNWRGWESRADFDELKSAVEQASTVAEIIRLVAS